MKKIIYIIVFLTALCFGSCLNAKAQSEISLPRDVAEKALKSLELQPKLETENAELRKLVRELQEAKQTSCSIAITAVKEDLTFWHQKFLEAPIDTQKEVKKTLGQRRKEGSLIIQKQCGLNPAPSWWKELLRYAPIAAAVLVK